MRKGRRKIPHHFLAAAKMAAVCTTRVAACAAAHLRGSLLSHRRRNPFQPLSPPSRTFSATRASMAPPFSEHLPRRPRPPRMVPITIVQTAASHPVPPTSRSYALSLVVRTCSASSPPWPCLLPFYGHQQLRPTTASSRLSMPLLLGSPSPTP
ncbi:putative helicase [Sesbania bispinosa]|nr:putative helicase [Sesbania bispinosa]